ncbi:hypothetical protein C8J56DRAFT_1064452 [Mycena floridula]|nr:hypothetical protein C8J56DRAFT_1064452 [Mycena floridula]
MPPDFINPWTEFSDSESEYDPEDSGDESDSSSGSSHDDQAEEEELIEAALDDNDIPNDSQRAKTLRLKQELDGPMENKVLLVMEAMDHAGINLPLFLDAFSWGDEGCIRNAKIRHARTVLMNSAELPNILEHWCNPPRNWKRRAMAATTTMEKFAIQHSQLIFKK